MYKWLFWSVIILLVIRYNRYIFSAISWYGQLFLIYIYYRPIYKYQIWYIKKHGWTPYWYESQIPEEKGKLYEHPDYWVHKDYKNTRYGDKGEYGMWSAWMISRGKEDANGKPIKK